MDGEIEGNAFFFVNNYVRKMELDLRIYHSIWVIQEIPLSFVFYECLLCCDDLELEKLAQRTKYIGCI